MAKLNEAGEGAVTSSVTQRDRISGRIDVPDLKAKVNLLLKKARNPRVRSVANLDDELGLAKDKGGFRQYYRKDRPSGLPGGLVAPFLALFGLTEQQLLLPLSEFETLLDDLAPMPDARTPDARRRGLWYDADQIVATVPPAPVDPGDVRFSWESYGLTVDFISESVIVPIGAPLPQIELLNLRRRRPALARVHVQSEFRIAMTLPRGHAGRWLGLIEGSQLTCFQKPRFIKPEQPILRLPDGGEPYYFDEIGRHFLWILAFGDVPLTAGELDALDSEDVRARQTAAERIYTAAQTRMPKSLQVFRADFDVVG